MRSTTARCRVAIVEDHPIFAETSEDVDLAVMQLGDELRRSVRAGVHQRCARQVEGRKRGTG